MNTVQNPVRQITMDQACAALGRKQTPAAPSRKVAVPVWGDYSITLDCPAWCIVDHASNLPEHPHDIAHYGQYVGPGNGMGDNYFGMYAHLVQNPLDPGDSEVRLAFSADGDTAEGYDAQTFARIIRDLEAYLPAFKQLRDQAAKLANSGASGGAL